MCLRRHAWRKIRGLITEIKIINCPSKSEAHTCVWAMMRMIWQYFFIAAKSFSSCFFPSSSCHFLQYLVKAFFLDLYLRREYTYWHRSFITQKVSGRTQCSSARPIQGGLSQRNKILAHSTASKKHFPLARGARSSSGHEAPERSCHKGHRNVRLTQWQWSFSLGN